MYIEFMYVTQTTITFYRNASNVSELEDVIKSQVVDDTFELLVRRSHILEDSIRGTQKRLFTPEKSLVVSITCSFTRQ